MKKNILNFLLLLAVLFFSAQFALADDAAWAHHKQNGALIFQKIGIAWVSFMQWCAEAGSWLLTIFGWGMLIFYFGVIPMMILIRLYYNRKYRKEKEAEEKRAA